jgi:PAS domain S-box-containing protein
MRWNRLGSLLTQRNQKIIIWLGVLVLLVTEWSDVYLATLFLRKRATIDAQNPSQFYSDLVQLPEIRDYYETSTNNLVLQAAVLSIVLVALGLILTWYSKKLGQALLTQQRTSDELRTSEERLELALIGGGLGTWDWHLDTQHVFLSAFFLNAMGYAEHEQALHQAVLLAWVHPDDVANVSAHISAHLKGKTPDIHVEARLKNAKGAYCWMSIQGKEVRLHPNDQRRVSGTVIDISAQKQALQQLADRREQLDAIFSLSPDAFVTFDRAQLVKFVNPAFERLTGLRPEQVLGQSESHFSKLLVAQCTPQKPFRGVANMRTKACESSLTYGESFEILTQRRRVLRVALKLSVSLSVSQILYLRDITHETIVEEMKTEFLSTAAHELRTPMAAVLGFAEVLTSHTLSQEEKLEFAGIILKQARNLSTILDELLDLARIESRAGQELLIQPVELSRLVKDVADGFQVPAGRTRPTIDVPETYCAADLGKAKQVILNVLSNAYKYSKPGTEVSITLAPVAATGETGAWVGICIEDHGIGMNEAQLDRVFDRFYRADKSGSVAGTGLGMSIVKELMKLQDGKVLISSTPRVGTTVYLLFAPSEAPNPSTNPV